MCSTRSSSERSLPFRNSFASRTEYADASPQCMSPNGATHEDYVKNLEDFMGILQNHEQDTQKRTEGIAVTIRTVSLMVVEWLAAKGLVASQAAAPEVLQLLPDLAWQQEHGLFALDPEELRVLGAGTSMHHWRDVALNETHTALEPPRRQRPASTPGMLCLLWLPALAEAIASVPFATESYSQHVEALQGRVTFYWAVDESKQILRAGVAAQTAGWLGVGFNAFPEMTGADIVMMSVDADGNPLAVQDLHATGFSTPVADVTQDVVVNSQGRSNGISWFTFERNLTNCDTQGDYQFVRIGNEFTLLVAVGDSHTWQNHGASNREAIRMRLVETASTIWFASR
eukprot:g22260.t1